MDRAAFKNIMAAGVLLNSALYLNGVFVAGLLQGNEWAWKLALVTFGVTYLSYVAQFVRDGSAVAVILVWLSIGIGITAGFALLFG